MTTTTLSSSADGIHETVVIEKEYVRFTPLNRTLHVIIIVSFISLALTGMTLKVLALSALTLPHALARVVLAEQLYRACSILHNHPYHRE